MPITLDDVRARTAKYTSPISESAPAGSSPSGDASYDFVRAEIARLESPSGGLPDWGKVVAQGSDVLANKGKEYLTAIYVAYSLFQSKGVPGLVDGLMLLAELEANYWDTMFPELKRIRGRVNALTWFVEKTVPALAEVKVTKRDRDEVMALQEVAEHFITVTREKFTSNSPAFGPLREAIGRIVGSLPAEAPPPPPPPPPPEPSAAAAAQEYTPEVQEYVPEVQEYVPETYGGGGGGEGGGVGDLASAEAAGEWFAAVSGSLARAAAVLRAANGADANAYRVLRQGAFLRFLAPPLDENGALVAEPPDATARAELAEAVAQEQWADVLERCELLTASYPLWLDLQRYAAEALSVQGEEFRAARDAVLAETGGFVRRMPEALGWSFGDGTPTADEATRKWFSKEFGTSAAPSAPKKKDLLEAAVLEAQGLVEQGDLVSAIALLQRRVRAATTAPARFKARLAVAKLAAAGGQMSLARALFEQLEREATAHGLEEWEPGFAAECLEGLIVAMRALAEAGIPLPGNVALLYDRLCRVDPVAAARIGG